MKINELNQRPGIDENVKLEETYYQFEKLLSELRKKELPDGLVVSVNKDIEDLKSISVSGDELRKIIRKKQTRIIKLLEKELKLVPKNYYRKLWLAVGMAAFGIPIGVALGASLGNMAFLGIGLPIGMAIGIAVGTGMDKKAFEEGRQIDLEIKY
jgi:predicted RND superfamily exporter protein